MNALLPFDFESHMVRVVVRAGDPWFVAGDVAAVLGFKHVPHMVRMLDDDEAAVHILDSRSANGVEQAREVTIISESGLYAVVLKSRREEARRFRKWVTADLLPTLRRTGRYALDSENPGAAEEAAGLVLADLETPRMQAFVALLRVAERLHGKAGALRCWHELGLPEWGGAPLDEADPLLPRLRVFLEGRAAVTIRDCARALGLGDAPARADGRRLGGLLRGLGWLNRTERLPDGSAARVYRPANSF